MKYHTLKFFLDMEKRSPHVLRSKARALSRQAGMLEKKWKKLKEVWKNPTSSYLEATYRDIGRLYGQALEAWDEAEEIEVENVNLRRHLLQQVTDLVNEIEDSYFR